MLSFGAILTNDFHELPMLGSADCLAVTVQATTVAMCDGRGSKMSNRKAAMVDDRKRPGLMSRRTVINLV